MIVKSFYKTRKDNVDLYISYSDNSMKIQQDQTGAIYDSAIDVETATYTYTETGIPVDEPVMTEPPVSEEEYSEAGRIMMGAEP